jgi:hypothetical protein
MLWGIIPEHYVTLIPLAYEQYRTVLLDSVWPYEMPMKGPGIGEQLGWLTEKLTNSPIRATG